MDGDAAPITSIVETGCASDFDSTASIEIQMGTMGKALGHIRIFEPGLWAPSPVVCGLAATYHRLPGAPLKGESVANLSGTMETMRGNARF